MTRRMIKNESGVVLLTVLAISVIMITLVIGLLSSNLNFVNVGQNQLDRIKADQLAKATFWRNFMSLTTGNGVSPTPVVLMQQQVTGRPAVNKPFTPSITAVGLNGGPNGTQQYDIQASYFP